MAEIDAAGRSTREINASIRKAIADGSTDITLLNPGARHNLAVAILSGVRIRIAASVGHYCGGLGDGASIEIEGSAGWGLAEFMLSGTVQVHGSARSAAAAALRNVYRLVSVCGCKDAPFVPAIDARMGRRKSSADFRNQCLPCGRYTQRRACAGRPSR
jgi:formylmethanofuran dehydrogenase subunit C